MALKPSRPSIHTKTTMSQAEDGSFPIGFPLFLRLDGEDTPTTFYVLQSFTPFTKSQVYLVRQDCSTKHPSELILKVYDPRFIDDRAPAPRAFCPYPWTLDVESLAAQKRGNILPWKLKDLDELTDRVFDGEKEPHVWEEFLFLLMGKSFTCELGAYKQLADLQGRSIPKLYGSGMLLPSPPGSRAIEPPVLLLEYIPSVTLDDIDTAMLHPKLYRPLINTVATFERRGILHSDFTLGNIIFTPPEAPERALVIDFGCAELVEYFSDEDWAEILGLEIINANKIVDDEGLLAVPADQNGSTKDIDQIKICS
ncbi:hypothetical protein V8B97DRAFT_1316449 [Scleroderma yunnanense]